MELTKDMFKAGLDIPLMLESTRIIVKNEGYCDNKGDRVWCPGCPMHHTQRARDCCLVAYATKSLRPDSRVFKAEALNLSRQFIALFDVPKTHHINFMEE